MRVERQFRAVRREVSLPRGRVPRVSRLMALAIRFEGLIRDGVVRNQAELARLEHVSRARVSQIMNLLNLAKDKLLINSHLTPRGTTLLLPDQVLTTKTSSLAILVIVV